jgi:hypothetical protein
MLRPGIVAGKILILAWYSNVEFGRLLGVRRLVAALVPPLDQGGDKSPHSKEAS